MLDASTLKFLQQLSKHNSKEWFDANRPTYEETRANFIAEVDLVIKGISTFDAQFELLQARQCVFRINRDVRFSKNKQPYKNNMSAYFNKDGKKGVGAGYYFHIEPGNSFIAAGVWMPEPPFLAAIRQEVDYNFAEWKKLTSTAGFKKQFVNGLDKSDTLVRPPKHYEEDNPAIEVLKLKSFVARKPFTDDEVLEKDFVKSVTTAFKTLQPMVQFLNRALP